MSRPFDQENPWDPTDDDTPPVAVSEYFEDDAGATRVLTPEPTVDSRGGVSATRKFLPTSDAWDEPEVWEDHNQQQIQQPMLGKPVSDTSVDRFNRVQFLPAVLGWLVAYSLLAISGYTQQVVVSALGWQGFDSFQLAFDAVVHPQPELGTGALWGWLAPAMAAQLVSFAAGGYAAARMCGVAAGKQGLGVWLWHLFAIIVATLFAFATEGISGASIPQLSLQNLLASGVLVSLPGLLTEILIGLLGCLIGASCGTRYYAKLTRANLSSL